MIRAEFVIIYRPPQKYITKIQVDIPTVDFVYLSLVGRSPVDRLLDGRLRASQMTTLGGRFVEFSL